MYQAHHRFARIAASKVRPWAELIRGSSASEGLERLKFIPNRGARMLEKVLRSAMANAEQKAERNVDDFEIVDSRVDEGPMFKRLHARARGTAYLIRRRFCHIHVGLDRTLV